MALIKSLAAHIKEDENIFDFAADRNRNEKFVVAVECIKECKKEGSHFHLDLARTFGKFLTLQKVFARDRNLGSVECDVIAEIFTKNTTVTDLDLFGNKLDSECADKICKMLCHNKTLTVLDSSGNKLGSEAAEKICEALYKNKTLEWLGLFDNNISDPVRKKLKEAHGHRIRISI